MKQILINYLSPLNRPQEDINHYIVELADDSLNGTHIEGYQTNEPIVKYCVQSAVERQAAFEHVISIRSDFVKGGECLIEKEKLDNNAYLEELWEYVEKDENGDEIIAYKQQDEDVLSYALFPQVATEFFKYREAQQNKIDSTEADTENNTYPV